MRREDQDGGSYGEDGIKMLAGDETERVAGCRLTYGPILWLCKCWTEAGMSMLCQVGSGKFEKPG